MLCIGDHVNSYLQNKLFSTNGNTTCLPLTFKANSLFHCIL